MRGGSTRTFRARSLQNDPLHVLLSEQIVAVK